MPQNKSKKKGGSPASNHVMKLMDTPIRVDGMLVLKGGSGASNNVMSLVQPVCACDMNLPPVPGKMAGSVSDFYLTSGGGRKKARKHSQKAGSVPYYVNMRGLCNNCGGVQLIDPFPSHYAGGKQRTKKKRKMKGGSGWLMVHNSRSANPMPTDQFKAFTNSEQFIAGGQNAACVYSGPMFQ